jgi:hypothetical protein
MRFAWYSWTFIFDRSQRFGGFACRGVMAEGEGFEPPSGQVPKRFSRPPP